MDSNNQMAEAGFSINFRILDAQGNENSITMRGQNASDWADVVKQRREFLATAATGGWKLVVLRQTPSQPAVPNAPQATSQQRPVQVASGAQTFHATKLSVSFSPTGKKMGKLHGGNYQKYGVTVWPEVATDLGLGDLEAMNAGEYQCDLVVEYVLNDQNKPQKVIGLAGRAAQPPPAVQQASHQEAGFGENDPAETPF